MVSAGGEKPFLITGYLDVRLFPSRATRENSYSPSPRLCQLSPRLSCSLLVVGTTVQAPWPAFSHALPDAQGKLLSAGLSWEWLCLAGVSLG